MTGGRKDLICYRLERANTKADLDEAERFINAIKELL